jgi:peptidoglycan biosynthesis protein MviN/MurJ (putative lipid II flippase)
LFNGLIGIPYQMQIANGWTSLMIKVNIIAVTLLVPAILLVVPAYGSIGAARVWVALNVGYLMFATPLMHRRLLPAEKWRWYCADVAVPLAAAAATAFLCRWVMPHGLSKLGEFSVLLVTSSCVLIAAALAAPLVRDQLARCLPAKLGSFTARAA